MPGRVRGLCIHIIRVRSGARAITPLRARQVPGSRAAVKPGWQGPGRAVQVETTTRAKAGRNPVAGRGGGGGDRRPWARPRTCDSDHHRPGPGRGATAGQRAGNSGKPLWAAVRAAVGTNPGIWVLTPIFHLFRLSDFPTFSDFCLGAACRVRESCAHMVLKQCSVEIQSVRTVRVPWHLSAS